MFRFAIAVLDVASDREACSEAVTSKGRVKEDQSDKVEVLQRRAHTLYSLARLLQ